MMKLKLTSSNLMIVILIQIILIDGLLIAFLFKQLSIKSHTDTQKNISSIKKDGNYGENKKDKVSPVEDRVIMPFNGIYVRKEGLLELMEKTDFSKYVEKVIKLPDVGALIGDFIATAYDLSYESCGKYPSHPAYGITFSGSKAVRGRTIAVDPNVIALGSKVYIEFPDKFSYLDGWYTAEDTGRLVKGNIIDIFLGESAFHEMESFGSRSVNVKILHPREYKK